MQPTLLIVEVPAEAPGPPVYVVHVHAAPPDHDRPWEREPERRSTFGVLIAPRTLLVPAHAVADVAILSDADGDLARVVAVHHDYDLALVEVTDDSALASHEPLPLATDVHWDAPAVLVQPTNILAGTLGPPRRARCAHSVRHIPFCTFKLDDAATPGDDDDLKRPGAVLQGGELVGLVTQHGNETLELVSPALLTTFLRAHAAGKPLVMPSLGIATQNTVHPALRAHLGLGDDDGGVLVTLVDHEGSCDGAVRTGDVLVAIDGQRVSRSGTIDLEGRAIAWDAAVATKLVGERVTLELVRAGERHPVDVTLDRWKPLVPRATFDERAQFIVLGGLVLQRLTRDYLRTWDDWWNKAPKELLNAYYLGVRTPAQHELVVLTSILEDPVNAGYEHLYNEVITRVDGHSPRSLVDVAERIAAARGHIRLETSSGGVIVMDLDAVREARARIRERHGISRECTPALRPVLGDLFELELTS